MKKIALLIIVTTSCNPLCGQPGEPLTKSNQIVPTQNSANSTLNAAASLHVLTHSNQITPLPNAPNVNSMEELEQTYRLRCPKFSCPQPMCSDSSRQPRCTYECLEKSSLAQCTNACLEATEHCTADCLKASGDFCCTPRCIKKSLMSFLMALTSPISCPLACIKDTVCLPCDRNETPPQCYPYTQSFCFFLTCELCGDLPHE